MSSYPSASKERAYSPNFTPGRTEPISGITIHWWGDPAEHPSFDGIVSHLCNPASQVSAHFVVEDGRVECLVHPNDKAWHAISGNTATIGIECNPRASDGDFQTLTGLVVSLWLNYGKVGLYKHSDWVATACPGVYAQPANWARIKQDADSLYSHLVSLENPARERQSYQDAWWNKTGSVSPSIPTSSSSSQPAPVAVDGYWGNATTRVLQWVMGTPIDSVVSSQDVSWQAKNPGLTGGWEWVPNPVGSALIKKLQQAWGTSDDGLIGPGTIKAMQRHFGTTQDGVLSEQSSAIMALQKWANTRLAAHSSGITPLPASVGKVEVDGYWGPTTTRALQNIYATPQDGVVSSQDVSWRAKNPGLSGGWEWVSNPVGSALIKKLQQAWGTSSDGLIGPGTIKAMQHHFGTTQDGVLNEQSSTIMAMQRWINTRNTLEVKEPEPNKPKPEAYTLPPAMPEAERNKLRDINEFIALIPKIEEAAKRWVESEISIETFFAKDFKRNALVYFSNEYLKEWDWWITVGESSSSFWSYMENREPDLHKRASIFATRDTLVKDHLGGVVDTAHLMITLLSYAYGTNTPRTWTSWAGDLATGAANVQAWLKQNPNLEIQKLADSLIGAHDLSAPYLRNAKQPKKHGPSCNYSDLSSNADAQNLSILVKKVKEKQGLGSIMANYYSTLSKNRRFQAYEMDLGKLGDLSKMATAIHDEVMDAFFGGVIFLKGDRASDAIVKAVSWSLANYIKKMLS